MEKLGAWVKAHKALAIALGIGTLVLLWLLLRGGSSSGQGTSALAAYYGAEAASQGAAANVAGYQNALAASTNQTNASATTAAAYIQALTTSAQLTAQTQQQAITAQEAIDMAAIAAAKPQATAIPVGAGDFFTESQALNIVNSMAGQPSYKQLDAVLASLQQADAVRSADLAAKGIKVA